MKYLLDTCVLSELVTKTPHAGVVSYIKQLKPTHVFLSVITLGEIAKGVALLPNGQRRSHLERWLNTLEESYSGRILPIDNEVARLWGELLAKGARQGTPIPAIDGLLAATALNHGLHLITRNEKDFQPTGAMILNPWVS